MEIYFFGTSSGAPTRSRNVAGLAVAPANHPGWYLVDCGEGTQQRLLRSPFSPHDLRAIFITHVHGDHCFGLPGLLGSAALAGRREPLEIVAPHPVREFVETAIRCSHLVLSYRIEFRDVAGMETLWQDRAVTVTRHRLSHRVPCWGFRFEERGVKRRLVVSELLRRLVPRGPLWARLQSGEDIRLEDGETVRSAEVTEPEQPRFTVVIAGDNDSPGLLREACSGAHVLVHEATFTEGVRRGIGADFQHCTAAEVSRFAEVVGVPNLVLTHFSARYQDEPGSRFPLGLVADEARRHYSGNLLLARDLTGYRVGRDGVLRESRP